MPAFIATACRLSAASNAARRRALSAFRKGVEDASQAIHTGIALGRGWLLFSEYLPREMPHFAERFAAATGLTLEQYLICVGALTTYTFADRTDGPVFRTAECRRSDGLRRRVPDLCCPRVDDPERLARVAPTLPGTGFRALRERPILSTPGGLSAVLDPAIYGETLTIGPLFHVVAANRKRANELFGYFGLAFERYGPTSCGACIRSDPASLLSGC